MALCPDCGDPLKRGRCDCGYVAQSVASFQVPPKLCSWDRCEEPTAIVFVEVEQDGRIRRTIASNVMTKGKMHDGCRFVRWVTRCTTHFYFERDRAGVQDWREEAIRAFQSTHPEFAVVPASEDETRDVISMARAFLTREETFETDEARHDRLRAELDTLRAKEVAA